MINLEKYSVSRPSPITTLILLSLITTFAVVILSAYIRLGLIETECRTPQHCTIRLAQSEDGHRLAPKSLASKAHRQLASILGLMILIINILVLRYRHHGEWRPALPLMALLITAGLAVLGFFTPTPRLPLVSFGNLTGGIALLAVMWWMYLGIGSTDAGTTTSRKNLMAAIALAALLMLILQIMLGAWASANFAGFDCLQISGCDQAPIRPADLLQGLNPLRQVEINAQGMVLVENSARAIHMSHRLTGLLTAALMLWVALMSVLRDGALRNTGILLICLILTQLLLGLGAVFAHPPLYMLTAHNGLAAILLLTMIRLHILVRRHSAG